MQPSSTVKPKVKQFERDFIILSEFSEQVGPVPVQYIPDENSKGSFDASHFSVRIMTSDYQSQLGKLVGEDTQVLLSEKQEQVYAYVHYFSLNDINARGYVRQYCFSYITSKFSKLVDNFELLKQQFSEVTSMLKCSNQRVFRKDLEHHLADLNHTLDELKSEGWLELNIDSSKLYQGFDFAMEDVPERDAEQVNNAIRESSEILDQLRVEMAREKNIEVWAELKRLRKLHKRCLVLQSLKDRTPTNSSPSLSRDRTVSLGSPDSNNADLIPLTFSDSLSSELTSSTSSIASQYQPQRVMTHTVHKFERRLRPLQDLSHKAFSTVMEKLTEIHKFFSRSEMTLEMEREETLLLDPRSSLLSIGRVPMINFLQNFNHFQSQTPCPLIQPRPYTISARNTWGQPSEFSHGEVLVDGEAAGTASGFDTKFIEDTTCLNKYPLYIDMNLHQFPYTYSFATTDPETSLNHSTLTNTLVRNKDPTEELHPPDLPKQDSSGLTVHQDEDQISRGSPAYLTPEGLTPSPSDDCVVSKSGNGHWLDQSLLDNITSGTARAHGKRLSDSEVGLDTTKRTLSQQSFASVSSSQSIHGDQLGGKTAPTITASEVTARPEASRRSRSLSPPTSTGIASSTSSDGIMASITESPTKEVLPNRCKSVEHTTRQQEDMSGVEASSKELLPHRHRSAKHSTRQLDDMAQVEETHSAGSGHFENGLMNFQSPNHLLGAGSLVEKRPVDGLPDHRRAVNKPLFLPRQVSSLSGQISPEKYHTPVGGPPSLFGPEGVKSPSRLSLASHLSTVSLLSPYRGPSLVELRGKGKLPLISSVDLVEHEKKFKPGKGIFNFWKDNTSMKDLVYCLLHGRPLAIIGSKPSDERDIRRLVRLLWMFIPGHSSKNQVITWQDQPLNVKDLSRVKLIGLSSKVVNVPGQGSKTVNIMSQGLKRHMSIWDISTGKITTPSYSGDLLKSIVSRTRDRKNEQAFMAHLLSVLLDISMKAYVYYHCYCASSKPPRQTMIGETAAKVYHSVLQRDSPQRQRVHFLSSINVKGCDVDIIEYLVDIIREQQLTEWRNGPLVGTPSDEEPVMFKLYTKQCRESTHKAKRPY